MPRVLAALLAPLVLAGCGVRYVASSAYHQLELLASREPADEVLASGRLSVGQEQRLRLIPTIKAYGRTLGLASTDNYDTVAVGWNRTIWNVSACDPLAFEPVTWTFPIVGRVPYLGFFTDTDAIRQADKLKAEGHDVHRRTAGAYSTLGWFRDPVLPGMLAWSEPDLAETVFHELAHATLWVPGSVPFNESFASFVGVQANHRYLAHTYGEASPELADVLQEERDYAAWVGLLHALYQDLDAVYRDAGLPDADKATRKAELYASLPDRIRASEIRNKDRFIASVARNPWNNARLMQFKAYNSYEAEFTVVLDRAGGDLRGFINRIRDITRHRRDPFVALQEAAAAPPSPAVPGSVQIP